MRAGGVVLLGLTAGCLQAPPAAGDTPPDADAGSAERAVSGTFRHFCAVIDGGAWCWGRNGYGQLGDGTKVHRSTAVQVLRAPAEPLTGVQEIAAGEEHTCARLENGAVICWGGNDRGQLGTGEADTSDHLYADTEVGGVPPVVSLSAGGEHTCARLVDDTVLCWGRGDNGELGDSGGADRPAVGPAVQDVAGTMPSSHVSLGRYHSCFIDESSAAACTGWNEDGQAGQRDAEPAELACNYLVAGRVSREDGTPLAPASDLSASFRHTCALVVGNVFCFGHARCGELGNDDPTPCDDPVDDGSSCLEETLRLYPVQVLMPESCSPVRLSLGYSHSCALCSDRAVQCWGSGARGRLGVGTIEQHPTPVQVLNLDGAVAIATGAESSCASLADRSIVCWGSAEYGQLGDGTGPDPDNTELYQTLPRPVVGLPEP